MCFNTYPTSWSFNFIIYYCLIINVLEFQFHYILLPLLFIIIVFLTVKIFAFQLRIRIKCLIINVLEFQFHYILLPLLFIIIVFLTVKIFAFQLRIRIKCLIINVVHDYYLIL